MKYSKAMQKLEAIIRDIESEEIDVDELSERVREAVSLVKVCREKVHKAELEVKEVVDQFENPAA